MTHSQGTSPDSAMSEMDVATKSGTAFGSAKPAGAESPASHTQGSLLQGSRPQSLQTTLSSQGRRPRILLGASGSVAAIKVVELAYLLAEFAEVKLVLTKAARHFVQQDDLPFTVHGDEEEWHQWQKKGDPVLHIELRKWADLLIVAPLSANTLAKMAQGLCDNCLTSIVRAWDFSKPLMVCAFDCCTYRGTLSSACACVLRGRSFRA
ncbi:hypothetical protein ABBQ38_013171 [Trebouxia sp. C0009 RCD-2024]